MKRLHTSSSGSGDDVSPVEVIKHPKTTMEDSSSSGTPASSEEEEEASCYLPPLLYLSWDDLVFPGILDHLGPDDLFRLAATCTRARAVSGVNVDWIGAFWNISTWISVVQSW